MQCIIYIVVPNHLISKILQRISISNPSLRYLPTWPYPFVCLDTPDQKCTLNYTPGKLHTQDLAPLTI